MVAVDNVNCAILKKAIINFSWRPFFTIRYFPTLGCAKWSKIHHVIIYLSFYSGYQMKANMSFNEAQTETRANIY